jgi:signal transduction histidine kinase
MSGGIKFRLVAFVLAMGLMVSLIAWTAHTSWERIAELQQKLTSVQLKSFQIADHFQQTILELNNTVLRYGVSHDQNDWTRFDVESKALDHWIDEQRPILPTEKEKGILDQINAAYDDYMAAAGQIHARIGSDLKPTTHLGDFADFERQSQRILNLAFQLAMAHRESMDQFLARSNKSLSSLRVLLLGSLLLLLFTGCGVAVLVYRGMIAPLQVKLVESQQLAERQEKLASLGMLAAGVAHEIRNPLTALKGWLFIQQKHLKPGTGEYEDAQVISSEINRLERIVRDFLLFASPSEPRLDIVSADQPLREVQTLLQPQLERLNVRLHVDGSVAAHVRIDADQIKQVLINLIQNAADSIGRNGAITLRVRVETKRLSDRTTEVVILEVADTGEGIPPEVEKRLFDPFFTTKESGTGLGLAIAARIIEKHGGALQYQTQMNRGTVFGIVLPRA